MLVSAGIGATPMVSMLDMIAVHHSSLETYYVHSARNGAVHAFRDHVRAVACDQPNIHKTTFYTRPSADDRPGTDFDQAGRIDLDWLRAHTPTNEADYYVCGPDAFIRSLVTGLARSGLSRERVHYEYFGAAADLSDAWPAAARGRATTVETIPRAAAGAAIAREKVAAAILGGGSDAVIVNDRDGTITLWNPGAERIFGFAEAEVVGHSLNIIVPEPLRERHWDGYAQTVASGRSRYGSGDILAVPGLHKDGHRVSLEFTIAMVHDASGTVEGMVAVLRDVTRRFEETRALRKRVAELGGTT